MRKYSNIRKVRLIFRENIRDLDAISGFHNHIELHDPPACNIYK